MEHDIIRKYADIRVKISGWADRVQQYPYDCPDSQPGSAAYRTFGYTTKHFIPWTSAQEIGRGVKWPHGHHHLKPLNIGRKIIQPEVNFCPYITTYQCHYMSAPLDSLAESRSRNPLCCCRFPSCSSREAPGACATYAR
ncbi:uncharacterized protein LOC118456423 [Anopheles albimanus]|uniref:Uncharacterized protein n=1 Tax=Anopheles albimanus TaxID=7167 RepID=A0A8W7K7S9_ANOAL|nr:uncharacterized protein LOC118456423 [Anopheles albimanus]XP_035773058.1 uncharacterized protein LOC118456423 [Anopheles albimanus]